NLQIGNMKDPSLDYGPSSNNAACKRYALSFHSKSRNQLKGLIARSRTIVSVVTQITTATAMMIGSRFSSDRGGIDAIDEVPRAQGHHRSFWPEGPRPALGVGPSARVRPRWSRRR